METNLETSSNISLHSDHELKSLPSVSIVIVNFNGGSLLLSCIASLFEQDYPSFEVILVDNGSHDGSVDLVEEIYPQVNIIHTVGNIGYSRGNNLGADLASGDYLAFLNPDTIVEPGWLSELIHYLLRNPAYGMATPKILILNSHERINTCGNNVHFTGIPSCRGWMQDSKTMNQPEEISSVSGAAFIVKKCVFQEIGGFDETFFLYAEDTDLSLRARLYGYCSAYVPASIIYHRYIPRFGPEKYFYLECNRYQVLLKNLYWKTLIVLLPALALTEIVVGGYALLNGRKYIGAKIKTYYWLVLHFKYILKARKTIQSYRCVDDRILLKQCTYKLSYGLPWSGFISRLSEWFFDPIFTVLYRFTIANVRW